MFTNQEAEYLLKLPKFIYEKDRKLLEKRFNEPFIWNIQFGLIAKDEENIYDFIWGIWQSEKNLLKMSLHHQDDETKTGLFRIDYNSGHINPAKLTDKVPKKFHPFAGKRFSIKEHHVHYHVEGYKSLAWALPIAFDNFPYKNLYASNILDIVSEFGNFINLQTKLFINKKLL